MDNGDVGRAVAAVTSTVIDLGLAADDVTVVQNSTRLSLRVLPCDLFARVAPAGFAVSAEAEVELAQQLMAANAPVAGLDARVEPRIYDCDGFAVSMWTYYDVPAAEPLTPADYADLLERLHVALRSVDIAAPHATTRVDEALDLVTDPARTPGLASADRSLLIDTLRSGRTRIERGGEQLLHGEPHAGNVLNTIHGPLFIDLETSCRGPVEFDVAHLPNGVGEHYPDVDRDLLSECQRLVLAMVGAWRWDVDDDFPNGLRYGRAVLDVLREGPPWPTIDELDNW